MKKTKYPPAFGGLHLSLLYQGKTRETYTISEHPWLLLMVTSDRLSTHNVVHKSLVKRKGQILTALTIFWLTEVLTDTPNHLVAWGRKIYDYLPKQEYPPELHLQAIVARRLVIDPIEHIFRAYLAGSLWSKFYSKGLPDPYGLNLPPGLPLMHQFQTPIFTPTDKSKTDDERNAAEIERAYPTQVVLARSVFDQGRAFAQTKGVELVDTKEEVGFYLPDDPIREEVEFPNSPIVGDEVLTPDSSRFTLLEDIREGIDPPWLDKQIARDEAERAWAGGEKVPLKFSPAVISSLQDAYHGVFYMLTGMSLAEFQQTRMQ